MYASFPHKVVARADAGGDKKPTWDCVPTARFMTAAGLLLCSGLLAWHAHPPRAAGARRAPPPRLAGPWRHSRDSPTPAGGGHVLMDYEDFCVEAAPA